MKTKPFHIKAVLFHFEGTLAQDDEQFITQTKKSIGCPPQSSLRNFMASLPKAQRKQLQATLEALELKAAATTKPEADAEAMIRYLLSKGLRLGIVSNKSLESIRRFLQNFKSIHSGHFNLIIGREELLEQKPDVNWIKLAAKKMNLEVEQILVLSSQVPEIQVARKTGAVTVFFAKNSAIKPMGLNNDYSVAKLKELKNIVRLGIPLAAGKLPNALLREFLNEFVFDDPSILINPGVGEDIAAVDVEAHQVLVLKSDPVTFATDSIGQYAVLVNANDIATSGATPRWLLTTLLFPCGTTGSQIRQVVDELKEFCLRWGITLCGGHTEITDAAARPIVTGMMAGTVAKNDLIDKRDMAKGDKILLTKRVAVEGTAIIAREFSDRLRNLGMPDNEIVNCRKFLDNISVMTEAKIAAGSEATTAMHDVTEGGLATALEELGIAGGHRIRTYRDRIPVFPETQKFSDLLGIDPLGLIGSGSLLICCRKPGCEKLMAALGKPVSR